MDHIAGPLGSGFTPLSPWLVDSPLASCTAALPGRDQLLPCAEQPGDTQCPCNCGTSVSCLLFWADGALQRLRRRGGPSGCWCTVVPRLTAQRPAPPQQRCLRESGPHGKHPIPVFGSHRHSEVRFLLCVKSDIYIIFLLNCNYLSP